MINVFRGVGAHDDSIREIVTHEHDGALDAIRTMVDTGTQGDDLTVKAVILQADHIEKTNLKTIVDCIPIVLHTHTQVETAGSAFPVLCLFIVFIEGVVIDFFIVIGGGHGGYIGTAGITANCSVGGCCAHLRNCKHCSENQSNLFHFSNTI